MSHDEKIVPVLGSLGLNPTEITILRILFESGELRATILARKAKLNRTTVYSTLNSLSAKGLVTSMDERNVLVFRSIEPHLLIDYIDRQKSALSKSVETFKQLLPEIENKRTQKNILPKIQFFKGVSGTKQAYEDTLENNSDGEISVFTGVDAIYNTLGEEWVYYYTRKRKNRNIHVSMISPDGDKTHLVKRHDDIEHRTSHIISKEYSFETEIDIYGNKVGLFSFSKNSKEDSVAVIIEDERIAKTLKNIFKYIWDKETKRK